MTTSDEKVLPAAKTSPKYKESSLRFRIAWQDYIEKEQVVKYEIASMIQILEKDDGYSRMEAIKKVVNDHNDLPGFSQATIYRELPEEMKNKELGRPNLSHEKLGQTNNNDNDIDYSYQEDEEEDQKTRTLPTAYDVKNAETEELRDLPEPTDTTTEEETFTEEPDTTYDKQFVDRLVKENAQLIEQFTFNYDLEVKDQVLPLKVTVYPEQKYGHVRLRKEKAK
jgi:hypothetical protein